MNEKIRRHHKKLTTWSLAVAAAAVLLLALSADSDAPAALAQTADTPTPETTVVQEDERGIEKFPPMEGKLDQPQYANMDSHLNSIVKQVQTGEFTAQAAAASAPVHSGESVAVTLFVTEGYAQDVWDWLERSGASPRNIGADYIEAYISVSLLADASQREGVSSVRTIVPPQPAQGTVVSEGVEAHGIPAWHTAGLKGQGVKVGVIDVGFKGFVELMGTELPASAQWRCYTEVGVFTANPTDCISEGVPESSKLHGTAVSEAVFDIAPEAEFYLANLASWADMLATVEWMVSEDVDVINHSVGWAFAGPGDGTSPFRNNPLSTVDVAVDGGIVWVNAAGNGALSNWFGPFTDADANDFQGFSDTGDECNAVRIELGPLRSFTAQLRWDDSWGGASKDLDLYLVPLPGGGVFSLSDAVAMSEVVQSGGYDHIPYERVRLEYGDVSDGVYCIAVRKDSGDVPSWVQLLVWGASSVLQHHTPAHSIGNPAESRKPGLLAVGASGRNAGTDDNSFDNPFDTTIIESFSSRGPTLDGRIKPDIVGADAGQSITYRSERNPNGYFFGTSQASPHVAGLAALVKQRFPEYTPNQITQYLKDHAEERGTAGADNVWGHGFARLPASDVPTPPADSCVETLSEDGAVNGSWDTECASESRDGSYASYYTFTLTQSAEVTITTDSSVDTFVYLREGSGRDGTVLHENDDIVSGNTNSRIRETLSAGTYTIEVTTHDSGETGDFTLTVAIAGAVQPAPSPDYDIKEYACAAEDLADLGSFALDSDRGPETFAVGYDGIIGYYRATWDDSQSSLRVVCIATQYDGVPNARWHGLNYTTVLQNLGSITNLDISEHFQNFVSPGIPDDMLSFSMNYEIDAKAARLSEVRFFHSETGTVSTVRFIVDGRNDYPSVDEVAGAAKRVAERVMTADPQDQSEQDAILMSEPHMTPR